MKKMLLHVCCAPCSVSVFEHLRSNRIIPTVFWFNPNIHPFTEFRMRKRAMEQFARNNGFDVIEEGHYDVQKFLLDLSGEFRFKLRCQKCYLLRLKFCAEVAKKRGFEIFSTTLLVSPYQNHDQIKMLAIDLAKKYDLKFYYFDFRPFFKRGQQKSRELGLYMQKYCGCIFSEEERFCSRSKRRLLKQLKNSFDET